MSPRAERGLKTALVLGVALAFRALWLASWPVGFSPDEAYGCRNAARFAVGSERLDPLALYEEGASQAVVGGHQPGLYYLLPVAAFRLLGYSPAVWRLTSVLPSLVTVLALYPFGRRALGERTAFLAALLLATSRWSASEARWGWHVTAAWGLLAPALVLFLRALRRDAPRTAAAAGLLGALPASFYPSAVGFALVPVPAALLARPFARRALAGYLLGALAGSVPSLVMAVRQPDAFLARGRAASVFAEASSDPVLFFVVGNLVHYAGLLFVKGDPLA